MGEVKQLPLFEGFKPDASELRLTGATAGRSQEYKIGQTVWLLVRGNVVGVNHERKGSDQALIRSHKVKILGAERVDAKGIVAEQLVREAADYLASLDDDTDEKAS